MEYQEIITFIMEIIGTIAFAASGAMVGMERKMDIFGVCVLGVVTSVGGGMIRDIVLGSIPPGVFTQFGLCTSRHDHFLCGVSHDLSEKGSVKRKLPGHL